MKERIELGNVLEQCTLCGQTIYVERVTSESALFCCVGCQTVYHILSKKNELEDFQVHPLFIQAVRSGLISNPGLLEEIRVNQQLVDEKELKKLYFEVQDLWCPSCAEVIRLLLLREKGVKN